MLGGLLSPDPNQFLSYENDGFFKSTQSVIGFPDGVTDTNGIVVPDSFGDWTDQPVGIVYFASDQSGVGNDAVPKSTLGGRRLWYPYLIHGFNPGASVFRVSGRPYHMLAVDHTLAAGTEISIPFQDGENLTFRVMNIPISSTPQRVALAVRRS